MTKSDTISVEKTFESIYRNNTWTNGSGPGSFPELNGPLLQMLRKLLSETGATSIIDIGCGDFQLWRDFDFSGLRYVGFDIVTSIVERNRSRIRNPAIRFETMPQFERDLPRGDVYLIKDVLIHLDNERSAHLLTAALERSAFVVMVNNADATGEQYNREIAPGAFRPVNVALPPFSLPVVETIVYGKTWSFDPRWPLPLARLFNVRVWPGQKHIQLIRGQRGEGHSPVL